MKPPSISIFHKYFRAPQTPSVPLPKKETQRQCLVILQRSIYPASEPCLLPSVSVSVAVAGAGAGSGVSTTEGGTSETGREEGAPEAGRDPKARLSLAPSLLRVDSPTTSPPFSGLVAVVA